MANDKTKRDSRIMKYIYACTHVRLNGKSLVLRGFINNFILV